MPWQSSFSPVSLSHVSHVWLCVIPWIVACRAPLSMGFLNSVVDFHALQSIFLTQFLKCPALAGRFFTTKQPRKPNSVVLTCVSDTLAFAKSTGQQVNNNKFPWESPVCSWQVGSLVWEDSTCCGATKCVHHRHWPSALETACHNYWINKSNKNVDHNEIFLK